MKKIDNQADLKEIPVPEYPSIRQRLKCRNCKYCSCNSCRMHSKRDCWYSCYRNYNKITVPKFVFSIILLIGAIVYNFICFSFFWLAVLNVTIVTALIIFIDIISDIILKHLFLSFEKRKKQKYDNTVKSIEEQNKIIRKKQLGITDEFETFVDNCKALYLDLEKVSELINAIFISPSRIEQRINTKFEEMLKELSTLNEQLSIYNYDDSSLLPIFNVYLPNLKDNSYYLLQLSKKNKLTENQKSQFSDLLEVFRKKLEDENKYLDTKLEQDFIIRMQALNKDMLPEYDGGENT